MARIRTIKPEFWDSPSTAQADLAVRLTYIAMWNWADDSGRGTANTKELEAFVFPNDDVTELPRKSSGDSADGRGTWRNFTEVLGEVAEAYGVRFYRVKNRPYYVIPHFKDHQSRDFRPKSKYPTEDQGEFYDVTSGNAVPSRAPEGIDNGTSEGSSGISADSRGTSATGIGEQGNRVTGYEGMAGGSHEPPQEPAALQGPPSESPPSFDSLDALADGYAAEQGDSIPYGTPEDPRCYAHRNDLKSDVPPCFKCKQARDMWAEREADASKTRRQAIDNCDHCDDSGWLPNTNPAQRCTHTGLPTTGTGPF